METGFYKHYKGKIYEVLFVALHSENLEEMVVYKPLYESISCYWVRPKQMFCEEVEINGKKVKRFERISDSDLNEHDENP